MKVLLATRNQGKLRELDEIAARAGASEWLELCLAPAGFDPAETGSSYQENSIIKARAAAELTGMLAVADDSGLEVDALDGAPGLRSARYCPGSDRDRRLALLGALSEVPDERRGAAFVCHMAVFDPGSESVICQTEGRWPGWIGREERGAGGFGYDPIFYMHDRDLTAAEMEPQEKNLCSHRGIAWRKVLDFLKKTFITP